MQELEKKEDSLDVEIQKIKESLEAELCVTAEDASIEKSQSYTFSMFPSVRAHLAELTEYSGAKNDSAFLQEMVEIFYQELLKAKK